MKKYIEETAQNKQNTFSWKEAGNLNSDFFDQGCENSKEGWEAARFINKDFQWSNYHALTNRLPLEKATLLDVGCGQGDLIEFLYVTKKQIKEYHGIDVSEKMINAAGERFGHSNFTHGNFLDPEVSFEKDIVIASSTYNYRISKDDFIQLEYLKDAISKMYKSCRRACAFSLLSYHGYEAVKNSGELVCYEPWDVMKFCLELTSSVIIDHASTPAEFIVSLYKED